MTILDGLGEGVAVEGCIDKLQSTNSSGPVIAHKVGRQAGAKPEGFNNTAARQWEKGAGEGVQ